MEFPEKLFIIVDPREYTSPDDTIPPFALNSIKYDRILGFPDTYTYIYSGEDYYFEDTMEELVINLRLKGVSCPIYVLKDPRLRLKRYEDGNLPKRLKLLDDTPF